LVALDSKTLFALSVGQKVKREEKRDPYDAFRPIYHWTKRVLTNRFLVTTRSVKTSLFVNNIDASYNLYESPIKWHSPENKFIKYDWPHYMPFLVISLKDLFISLAQTILASKMMLSELYMLLINTSWL
jgi:hypothetical protein